MKNLLTTTIGTGLNLLSWVAPRETAKAGFLLFCYPMRAPVKSRHRQFLESGDVRDIFYGDERIRLYSWGHGPKQLLFVHGWQSHSYRWKAYVEALDPEEYTMHAFDAPGHGQSSGRKLTLPLYAQVMERVMAHIGPVHGMVGHSLGAISLLYFLHRQPWHQPEKLVLLASPAHAQEFFDVYRHTLGLSERMMRLTRERFISEIQQTPEYFSGPDFASSLTIPGLMIHDEGDPDTPADGGRQIHSAWKNSELKITSGLGHNLRSPEVVDMVTTYLRDKPTMRAAS